MLWRPRHKEQTSEELESEPEEELPAPEPPVPTTGYRVAGDVQVRVFELEQELRDTKAQLRAHEREVFAARKAVRKYERQLRTRTALSKGGLGAAIGATIGLSLYWSELVQEPAIPALFTLVAFVFGALLGMRWDPPDDNFPKAPPPRLAQ